MEDWGNDVLRLAASILGNRNDAEDIFQTVFLKLIDGDRQFTDAKHAKAWLLRVTMNCCRDELKSARRRRVDFLEDFPLTPLSDAKSHGVTERESSPEDELAAERLREALAALPMKQRVALHLFYYEELKTDEIAAIMGENPATVRSHLRRARTRLKSRLGDNHG
jgi:RNA polymerase sigma-70 factor (ECF subfamily)